MHFTAKQLAEILDGSVEGNPEVIIDRPSKIEEGGVGSISFLGNAKYERYAYTTSASALLVNQDFQPRKPIQATLIRVENVYNSIATLLKQFGYQNNQPLGVSEEAFVHPAAKVGEGSSVGRLSIIEEGAQLGANCVVYPQVYIGANTTIGDNVRIYPGVRILHDCHIGDHCIIHPNAVLGSDGFGFAPREDGTYEKIDQIGNVILEDWVEVGANTTIDRATMGSTIIRRGVKLDNLVQIAHNVEIGENTAIAAQTGIAGSTKIGKNCRIGGQVGFIGHLQIADGTQIQAQSGVASSVKEPNQALFGYPAFSYKDFVRSHSVFKKLPELYRRLYQLEKQLKDKQ